MTPLASAMHYSVCLQVYQKFCYRQLLSPFPTMCLVPIRPLVSAEATEAFWAERGVTRSWLSPVSITKSSQSLRVGAKSTVWGNRASGLRLPTSLGVYQQSWDLDRKSALARVRQSWEAEARRKATPALPCWALTASTSVNCAATSCGGNIMMMASLAHSALYGHKGFHGMATW
jgi:hypothetical protein